jgi:hypothetical protein
MDQRSAACTTHVQRDDGEARGARLQSVSVNRRYWQLTKISTLFHSKLEMPSYMKVVSLNKLDNFHIGRF